MYYSGFNIFVCTSRFAIICLRDILDYCLRDFLQNLVFIDFNLAFKSEKHVALNVHFDGPDELEDQLDILA